MKTNSLITTKTALAISIAGAVLLVFLASHRTTPESGDLATSHSESKPPFSEDRPRRISDAAKGKDKDTPPSREHKSRKGTPRRKTASDDEGAKKPLPDALMRLLVDEAVNANDYKKLSALLGKLDRIDDPEIRLRLLEGLTWFDETAVADSLPFLLDSDERIAATAAEVVSSRISSISRPSQREQVYVAALKLMPEDSPDRAILLATLENDRKSVVIHALRDLEETKAQDPALWKRLTEIYEAHFDRPYVNHVDALLHYDPNED